MKVLILGGSGVQGRAAAYDLVRNQGIHKVILAGRNREALEAVARWLDSNKCRVATLDASAREETAQLIRDEQIDVVVSSVPWKATLPPLEAALETGVDLVDFGLYQNAFFHERLPEYHERARRAGTAILPSCGLAPGMTNMLAAYGAGKMDTVDAIQVYVGGVPEKPQPPLSYKTVWSLEGVWTQFMEDCRVVQGGRLAVVEATTGREILEFPGLGTFEAAFTDGLGTLLHVFGDPLLKGVKEVYEKTIRWPGHYDKIRVFKECGLLNTNPVDVGGCSVSPREFLSSLLAPALKLGEQERDMTVLRVKVIGDKGGLQAICTFEMVDYRDEAGILSMGRTTGFTGAILVDLLAKGRIKDKGVVIPEKLGADEALFSHILKEYAKRNILIREG